MANFSLDVSREERSPYFPKREECSLTGRACCCSMVTGLRREGVTDGDAPTTGAFARVSPAATLEITEASALRSLHFEQLVLSLPHSGSYQ